ncbi:hypothetical protein [Pistricoccus aurantiacus]|uniref:hypothetical protein n=1 Tax=Pistricoccus aurantiacus TaxID=1883414 RepID=UPI00362A5C30
MYLRGSLEKADITADNTSDENAFYLSGGYLFHDKRGVELGVNYTRYSSIDKKIPPTTTSILTTTTAWSVRSVLT